MAYHLIILYYTIVSPFPAMSPFPAFITFPSGFQRVSKIVNLACLLFSTGYSTHKALLCFELTPFITIWYRTWCKGLNCVRYLLFYHFTFSSAFQRNTSGQTRIDILASVSPASDSNVFICIFTIVGNVSGYMNYFPELIWHVRLIWDIFPIKIE